MLSPFPDCCLFVSPQKSSTRPFAHSPLPPHFTTQTQALPGAAASEHELRAELGRLLLAGGEGLPRDPAAAAEAFAAAAAAAEAAFRGKAAARCWELAAEAEAAAAADEAGEGGANGDGDGGGQSGG